MKKSNRHSKEDIIDLKLFFKRLVAHWPLFIFFLILSFGSAFFYIRYSDKIYNVRSSILVRDKSKTPLVSDNLISGLEGFSIRKKLEDEIGLLKSFRIIRTAVSKLNFSVSYFASGDIKSHEKYLDFPFVVELLPSEEQLINVPVYLTLLADNRIKVEVTGKEADLFNSKENKAGRKKLHEVKIVEEMKAGEVFISPHLSFKVSVKDDHGFSDNEKYYFEVHDINKVAESFQRQLSVKPINKESNIIELSIEGAVAEKQIDFLDMLMAVYIGNGLSEKNQMAVNTMQFIDAQLEEISESLKVAENELVTFRAGNKVMDIGPASQQVFARLEKLEADRSELVVKDKYYRFLLSYLQEGKDLSELSSPSAIDIKDPLLNNTILELSRLYQEKTSLPDAREKNPYLISLDAKIRALKDGLLENVQNIIHSSSIALKEIDARIIRLEKEINQLPHTEQKLVNIQRKFNLNDHLYNYLLEKRAEAGIAKASNIPDNSIVDDAKIFGEEPVSPKKGFLYAIALIFGLISPFFIVVCKQVMNDKILTIDELERNTSIPVLGMIGHSKRDRDIILIDAPKSIIAESFRNIRINLQYMAAGKDKKIIGVTSSVSGEGKTFCSANLAAVFAASGKKTLLIGSDMRKPRINSYFNLSSDKGLSSYLIGHAELEEVIQPSAIENLDVIVSGPVPPNPVELIGLSKMELMLEELRSQYDCIILDTPPMGLVSEYFILMKYLDVHVYVIRHDYTKWSHLKKINELFERKKIRNVSLVVNDIKTSELNSYGYCYDGNGYSGNYFDESRVKVSYKNILEKNIHIN